MRIFYETFCRGNSIWRIVLSLFFVFGLFAGMVDEGERTAFTVSRRFDSLFTECRKRTVQRKEEKEETLERKMIENVMYTNM